MSSSTEFEKRYHEYLTKLKIMKKVCRDKKKEILLRLDTFIEKSLNLDSNSPKLDELILWFNASLMDYMSVYNKMLYFYERNRDLLKDIPLSDCGDYE